MHCDYYSKAAFDARQNMERYQLPEGTILNTSVVGTREDAYLNIGADLNHAWKEKTIASCGLYYQARDAVRVLLGVQSHFANLAHDSTAGVGNACSEQS